MYREKRIIQLVLVLMIMGLLTGCGQGKNESIDAGMTAISDLDYNGALECFDKALVDGENSELIYRGQGIAYMGLTMYPEAVEAFTKSLSYNNGKAGDLEYDINYYLAVAYCKQGDLENAANAYSSIIALKPKARDAYYLRGIVELKQENSEAAIADFDKAIAQTPDDYSLCVDIYSNLEECGFEAEGTGYLQTALSADSKAMTDYERGRLCYYMKDYDNARNYLEKARDSGGEEANLLLGKAYEALGDSNYAASVYTNYLDSNPESAKIYNQFGLCKLNGGEYDAALAAFQTAIALENNDIMQSLKYNEIVTYEYLGDFDKAKVLLETYMSTYPGDTTAEREYEFLKTR